MVYENQITYKGSTKLQANLWKADNHYREKRFVTATKSFWRLVASCRGRGQAHQVPVVRMLYTLKHSPLKSIQMLMILTIKLRNAFTSSKPHFIIIIFLFGLEFGTVICGHPGYMLIGVVLAQQAGKWNESIEPMEFYKNVHIKKK